jgi:plasmid stabilization system protein ParE
MIVRFARRAEQDLAEILDYLAEHSPRGAQKVGASLQEAVRLIADQPKGGKRTGLPAILVKIVPKYPYKIFYRVDGEAIDILHIRHASRRPWIA